MCLPLTILSQLVLILEESRKKNTKSSPAQLQKSQISKEYIPSHWLSLLLQLQATNYLPLEQTSIPIREYPNAWAVTHANEKLLSPQIIAQYYTTEFVLQMW